MLKLTNTAVMNFENAFRGMRNPLSSWAKSDSTVDENGNFIAGEADLGLACRLAHRCLYQALHKWRIHCWCLCTPIALLRLLCG